jgi:RimJ/RimL family protein N-acetyltransferase
MSQPVIKKVARIRGRHLVLRDARAGDAAFILSLRTDEAKARHLSNTSASLADQVAWLERYAQRAGEAYFIIESADGDPLGTVRLYDARHDSFCWGSWILKEGAPSSAAIESALMIYAFGIDVLGFSQAHFQVRRDNERVWLFHERFGAARTHESADEYEYVLSNGSIRASMQRYRRFLPDQLFVEP